MMPGDAGRQGIAIGLYPVGIDVAVHHGMIVSPDTDLMPRFLHKCSCGG